MIKLILKRIWKQRKNNTWLFIECLVVSLALCITIDLATQFLKYLSFPSGFSANDVYEVNLGIRSNLKKSLNEEAFKNLQRESLSEIKTLLKENKDIDEITMIHHNYSWQESMVDTITRVEFAYTEVDPQFFKVFDVNILELNPLFKSEDISDVWTRKSEIIPSIISEKARKYLYGEDSEDLISKTFTNSYDDYGTHSVVGLCEDLRFTPLKSTNSVLTPLDLHTTKFLDNVKIYVKSNGGKPKIDKLSVGPYYLKDVQTYIESKEGSLDEDNLIPSIITLVIIFLLFNLFLGTSGVFRYRISQRHSEIGLRMAVGSSRSSVLKEFIIEGLIILVLAYIPVLIIIGNLFYLEILLTIFEPLTISRFLLGTSISFLIMCIIISTAIYGPALKASRMNPVDALKEE